MAKTVRCPICSALKHIYREMQRAFYCCGATHIVADCTVCISKDNKNSTKKTGKIYEDRKKSILKTNENIEVEIE